MSSEYLDESKFKPIHIGKVQYGDWLCLDDGVAEFIEEGTTASLREGMDINWLIDNADVVKVLRPIHANPELLEQG